MLRGCSNLGKLCREVVQVEVTKPRNHLGMLIHQGPFRVAFFQPGLLKQSLEKQVPWKQPAPRRGPDRPSVQMKVPQPHGVLAWSHKQQLTIARKKLRKPHQTSVEDKWLLSKKAQDIVLISPLHEKHEFSRTVMVSLPFLICLFAA